MYIKPNAKLLSIAQVSRSVFGSRWPIYRKNIVKVNRYDKLFTKNPWFKIKLGMRQRGRKLALLNTY